MDVCVCLQLGVIQGYQSVMMHIIVFFSYNTVSSYSLGHKVISVNFFWCY